MNLTKKSFLPFLIVVFVLEPFISSAAVSNTIGTPPAPSARLSSIPQPSLPAFQPSQIQQTSEPVNFLDQSIPVGFGVIDGRVINDDTGEPISNVRISISELKISTVSDVNGNFKFDPISIGTQGAELDVTLVAQAPGFGKHTMINVGVVAQDTVHVILPMKKGSAPTNWFGRILKNKGTAAAQTLQPMSMPNSMKFLGQAHSSGPQRPGTVSSGSGTVSALTFSSTTAPPDYIFLAILPLNTDGSYSSSIPLYRTAVDFDFYMKHVLGVEWISSWNAQSLRAGAMAVKEYGWYHVLVPKYPNSDCDNSQSCQVYNPYISWNTINNAIDYMSGLGWKQGGSIFQSQYCNGTEDGTRSCGQDQMSQNGSKYWGDFPRSKTYDWMLNYYYGTSTTGGGAITYFTYPPHWPTTYVSSATTNSITLSFSSASSTWYAVQKLVGGSWTVATTTQNTSYTDTGLTAGQLYYYAVNAYGAGGWSPTSFNAGLISATPRAASNPPAPTTNVFFIATSTIKISAKSTTPGIDSYNVYKWNGSSWLSAYSGYPNTIGYARNDGTSTTDLPAAYLDYTDADGGPGNFVFRDTGLTANTSYSYGVNIHTSTGWSDTSNYGGAVTGVTAKVY